MRTTTLLCRKLICGGSIKALGTTPKAPRKWLTDSPRGEKTLKNAKKRSNCFFICKTILPLCPISLIIDKRDVEINVL